MRDPRVGCTSPQEVWPSSKCQRILRPLKLKIVALERTLSTSQSVADGISSWTDHLTRNRCRREPSSDSSAAYNPSSTHLRKYGTARRRVLSAKDKTESKKAFPNADQLLLELRSSVTPSVSAAYLGVYYAFKTLLDRVDVQDKFPSLASHAALALGRCIHLTSSAYTEQPIAADDWYDAAPGHFRAKVTVGHAAQIIMASYTTLAPIMPALTLLGKPCSSELLSTILDHTVLLETRKTDMQALQSLAEQVGKPWALKLYYTQKFSLEYIRHVSFSVLSEPKLAAELDDHTLALYIKSFTSAIQHLKRYRAKSENDLKMIDHLEDMSVRLLRHPHVFQMIDHLEDMSVRLLRHPDDLKMIDHLEDMSVRLLRHPQQTTIAYFTDLYGDVRHEPLLGLNLAFSLASLNFSRSDRTLITRIAETSSRLSRCSVTAREQTHSYLVNVWSTDVIVEIVELLVGRIDDLAIALAQECAKQFEGDFTAWAITMEADILAAKCSQESEKYRFEPLLDSWVARTPGLKKLSSNKILSMSDTEDDEDEETGSVVDEEDYQADSSRTCLSFAEIDCDLEDDLLCEVASPRNKFSDNVLNILSAKRSSDKQESAKVLKRYGRLAGQAGDPNSPLVLRSRSGGNINLGRSLSSPLQKTRSKRKLDSSETSATMQMPRVLTRAKWRKLSPQDNGMAHLCTESPPILPGRVMRKPLRELNNLKSSFAALRKLKKRPIAYTPDFTDDDLTSEQEEAIVLTEHPRSESDELSML